MRCTATLLLLLLCLTPLHAAVTVRGVKCYTREGYEGYVTGGVCVGYSRTYGRRSIGRGVGTSVRERPSLPLSPSLSLPLPNPPPV
jgi:hypothetical protein